MKKVVRTIVIFIFCLFIFSISKKVEANYINEIAMDIYIEDNGDANITETWDCYTNKGTEVYHPYYNLGKSKITDLTVSENGTTYQTLSSWNTSGSLSSKAYKCGINKISNGVEICWGMNNYKSHRYIVKYKISKFIAQLNDSQMLYWTLIPYDFSTSIGNVKIEIETSFKIADTIDVWGYGNYGGTAYVADGKIEMNSPTGGLDTNQYMTLLVKFPDNTFNITGNTLNYDFEYYYNMAEKGTVKYNKEKSNELNGNTVLAGMVALFMIIVVWVIIIISAFKVYMPTNLEFGPEGRKIPKDVPYFRDIPCKGEIFRAYYIAYNYGLMKKKNDVLGAIILKWLKDGLIRIETKNQKGILKKENVSIILNETDLEKIVETPKEKEIYRMLKEASIDGILEGKEFERWCQKHYKRILNWFDNILEEQRKALTKEGKIIEKNREILGHTYGKKYIATKELKEEAIELAGLKRFLKEYTLMAKREPIEVKLFEEYLIYAQIMGIAKEVAKNFKDIYPEIIEESHFNTYDNIIFINTYTSHGIGAAMNARAAENYSSGGGGFSSGGGRTVARLVEEEAGGGFR